MAVLKGRSSKLKTAVKLKVAFLVLQLFLRTAFSNLICTFHADIFVKNQSFFIRDLDINYVTDFDGKIFGKNA